jgi:hypothetical protein
LKRVFGFVQPPVSIVHSKPKFWKLWGCGGFSAKHMNELEALKDLKLLDIRRPFHGQKPFGGQDVKSLKTDLPQCNIRAGDRFY